MRSATHCALLIALLGFSLPAAGCDDAAKDAKSGDAAKSGDKDEEKKDEEKKDEEKKDEGADAKEGSGEPCRDLVEKTQSLCRAVVETGSKGMGCMQAVTGIETARKQAKGDLFDVGDDNRKAANGACGVYLSKAAGEHEKIESAAKVKWGTECTKYVEYLDKTCIEPLGKSEIDGTCKGKLMTFGNTINGEDLEKAEFGCGMAMRMAKGK